MLYVIYVLHDSFSKFPLGQPNILLVAAGAFDGINQIVWITTDIGPCVPGCAIEVAIDFFQICPILNNNYSFNECRQLCSYPSWAWGRIRCHRSTWPQLSPDAPGRSLDGLLGGKWWL